MTYTIYKNRVLKSKRNKSEGTYGKSDDLQLNNIHIEKGMLD